jgi:hypothetical protein
VLIAVWIQDTNNNSLMYAIESSKELHLAISLPYPKDTTFHHLKYDPSLAEPWHPDVPYVGNDTVYFAADVVLLPDEHESGIEEYTWLNYPDDVQFEFLDEHQLTPAEDLGKGLVRRKRLASASEKADTQVGHKRIVSESEKGDLGVVGRLISQRNADGQRRTVTASRKLRNSP